MARVTGEACDQITLEILDEGGRSLFTYEPELECAFSPSDYIEFAEQAFDEALWGYASDASGLPVGEDIPPLPYFYIDDYALYDRAVETGGPLVCFHSYDFGSACAWFDPEQDSGVILYESGS